MTVKEIRTALHVGPRTKRTYLSTMGAIRHLANQAGAPEHRLWAAVDGFLMFTETGRSSGEAYWYLHRMRPWDLTGLVAEVTESVDYPSVSNMKDAVAERVYRALEKK